MVMHVGRNNMKFQHVIDKCALQEVTEEKDLKVFVSNNLKPARQCHEAYSKASKALGHFTGEKSKGGIFMLVTAKISLLYSFACAVFQLSLLTRATSDESDPTPGYMLPEINSICDCFF